jgi:hypothetical protein
MNISYVKNLGQNILTYFDQLNLNFASRGLQISMLLLIIIIVVFLIDLLLSRSIFGKNYRIFVAPGVVLHEFSHAIFCLLTGAKIVSITLFDKDGGKVIHEKPKLPIIGQVLISLAPFAVGLIAIYFLSLWAGLKHLDLASIPQKYDSVIPWAQNYLSNFNFHTWVNWVILYLILSIAVTMTPSLQDFKNISLVLIFLTALTFLARRYWDFRPTLDGALLEKTITLSLTVAVLLILCLLLSIVIFAISLLFKKVQTK